MCVSYLSLAFLYGIERNLYLGEGFLCVIPVVCVTNKEGGVVKQHN
jgi:hypothetical protein